MILWMYYSRNYEYRYFRNIFSEAGDSAARRLDRRSDAVARTLADRVLDYACGPLRDDKRGVTRTSIPTRQPYKAVRGHSGRSTGLKLGTIS